MNENKLNRFNPDSLPAYFNQLTPEQKEAYLEKLASNNADLIKYASKKVADSKTAEHDMGVELDYIAKLETENKMINIKRTYETGSGKMEINIKGGDKKLIIPIFLILGIVLIAALLIVFWQ
jgi:hypothetical protein